jgi:type IV pilus assembly protein PilY1
VFGSGPTGPIDTLGHQFLGQSSRELKFFVVDLRTGELAATIPTGLLNAFAGPMGGAGIDVDRNYQDDALYVGYSQQGSGGAWSGGVLRLVTGENTDPSRWQVSKVIDGLGPVTSGIARLQDTRNHNLWLYFGTGRYFFNQDDMTDRRSLYTIQQGTLSLNGNYMITFSSATLSISPKAMTVTAGAKSKSYGDLDPVFTYSVSPSLTRVTATVTDGSGNTSVAYRNIIRTPKLLGDLNGDGRVDLVDAVLALRISIGLEPLTADVLARADVAPLVNGVPQPDGKLDVGDVVVILRKAVGLVDF